MHALYRSKRVRWILFDLLLLLLILQCCMQFIAYKLDALCNVWDASNMLSYSLYPPDSYGFEFFLIFCCCPWSADIFSSEMTLLLLLLWILYFCFQSISALIFGNLVRIVLRWWYCFCFDLLLLLLNRYFAAASNLLICAATYGLLVMLKILCFCCCCFWSDFTSAAFNPNFLICCCCFWSFFVSAVSDPILLLRLLIQFCFCCSFDPILLLLLLIRLCFCCCRFWSDGAVAFYFWLTTSAAAIPHAKQAPACRHESDLQTAALIDGVDQF